MYHPSPRICGIDWNTICLFDPVKLEANEYVGIEYCTFPIPVYVHRFHRSERLQLWYNNMVKLCILDKF